MKNFKQIAFGLMIGALAISFSAFTSVHNRNMKINRNSKGQIINVTTYFFNKDGNPLDKAASNFIYKDPSVDPDAGCTSGSVECDAQWMTSSAPTNGQSPTDAGSPSYVGNGQEIGPYNGL